MNLFKIKTTSIDINIMYCFISVTYLTKFYLATTAGRELNPPLSSESASLALLSMLFWILSSFGAVSLLSLLLWLTFGRLLIDRS